MVQRRGGRSAAQTNPFDSDDESPAKSSSSYVNPFDEQPNPFDDPPVKSAGKSSDNRPFKATGRVQQNPFDDDVMWSKSKESKESKEKVADVNHGEESSGRPRRRDKVKEKLTSVSDDIATKASQGMDYVRPRSRNLMGTSKPSESRESLLGEEKPANFRNEEKKYTRARIDKAYKAGESLEGESVQELEDYAVHKAEETTKAAYHALKVAEDIKETATNTSIMLHEQGQQITRTHETAADIDVQLSRGEKLLGSLGGLFSKTWKPKKSRNITGPMITRGDSFKRKAYAMDQRAALGLNKATSPKGRVRNTTAASANSSGSQFQSRVKNEFDKQDDAFADLSNVLDQLKEMSVDMGSEIRRQTESLSHAEDDITELGARVQGANERTRRLLGR